MSVTPEGGCAAAPVTLAAPDIVRNPLPLLEQLRQEGPIFHDPVTGYYVVTRYDDVVKVLQNPALFSSKNPMTFNSGAGVRPSAVEVGRIYAEEGYPQIDTLITNDPPSHTQYRALVDKQFTAANVRKMEPMLEQMSDDLLAGFVGAGQANYSAAFASKLPIWVIADQLGIPRERAADIKQWSDMTIEVLNPQIPAERELHIAHTLAAMQRYLEALAQGYETAPVDNLYSRLVHAEMDGRRLQAQERVALAYHILVAGNETTVNALELAVFLLARHPELQDVLRAEPGRLPAFIEEVVRMNSPIPNAMRVTTEDVDYAGIRIPKNSVLLVSLLSANHDASVFACPYQVDLDRRAGQQLGFSRGIHSCLGIVLARAEMRIAIGRLLARVRDIRLDPDHPEPLFRPLFGIRKLEEVHIRFNPA